MVLLGKRRALLAHRVLTGRAPCGLMLALCAGPLIQPAGHIEPAQGGLCRDEWMRQGCCSSCLAPTLLTPLVQVCRGPTCLVKSINVLMGTNTPANLPYVAPPGT